MREDDETNAEYQREVWVDEDTPQFWGVYGRKKWKGDPDAAIGPEAEWIIDLSSEKKALAFVRRLNGRPTIYD